MGQGAKESSTTIIRRRTTRRSASHPGAFSSRMEDGGRLTSTLYGMQRWRKDPGPSLSFLNREPNFRGELLLLARRILATSVKSSSAPIFIAFTGRPEAGVQQE